MHQTLKASPGRDSLGRSFHTPDQRLVKAVFVLHTHHTLQGVVDAQFRALEAAGKDRISRFAAVQSTCVVAPKPRKSKQRWWRL